ncbi:MAG: hypothetical protein Q6358_10220, partial [Candidatus Brocadiales bacterium]|nr:hypothetical protein [Candidatus Brocadiales bacterium]
MKFSTKFTALFSVIGLVIILVLSYLVYSSNLKMINYLVEDNLEDHAFHTIDKIDRMLFERCADIKVLATAPVIISRNSTPAQITERLLEYKNTYKAYSSLSFFNLSRIRIADTAGKHIGKEHAYSEYWPDIAKGKDVVMNISESESLEDKVFH